MLKNVMLCFLTISDVTDSHQEVEGAELAEATRLLSVW